MQKQPRQKFAYYKLYLCSLLTIDSVVVSVCQAYRSHSDASVCKLTVDVLRVFVDARHHIPRHRCLPLFHQLITTLDTDKSLACACMLIVENAVRTRHLPQPSTETEPDVLVNLLLNARCLCLFVFTVLLVNTFLYIISD